MNINCVICSDLFVPQAEVYVTPCGHMFHYPCLLNWLERSRTCPQCRNKTTTTSIHRIYFNLASSEGITEDASALQFKIDNLEFQMKLKEKDILNFAEKYKKTKVQNDGLRAEVARLEDTERANKSTMLVMKDQIQFFKKKAKEVERANEEMFQLRQKIKDMENVETAIKGSRDDVENILENQNDVVSLALLVSTLKKSLMDSESKKASLQFKLKKTQTAHSHCDKSISELRCEYESLKRQLESLKVDHEKEVRFLKEKYEQLHKKLLLSDQLSQSVDDSFQRIILESPINYNSPLLKCRLRSLLGESSTTNMKSATVLMDKQRSAEEVTQCEPMSAVVSTSVSGVPSNAPVKVPLNRGEAHKYSIFKSQDPLRLQPKFKPSEVVYDGLGGSRKQDMFPDPADVARPVKKAKFGTTTSAKLKKLSPSAGQKRKVTDFF